ncbi:MAG: alpha/beta hydrolase [Acidimicrobiales bacterium]
MDLDPDLAALVENLPALDFDDIPAARKGMGRLVELRRAALAAGWDAGVTVSMHRVSHGEPPVEIEIERIVPDGSTQVRGALIWFHGGGFAVGDAAGSSPLCMRFAREAGIAVFNVDYRLAPEYPFPAGVEDAYAALRWVTDNANELGVDPHRIAVGGPSAGGGLAAGLTHLACERGGPSAALQLLVYPVLDDRMATWSVRAFTDVPVWTRANTASMWRHYLGDLAGETPPAAAPARARDLSGLPPAFVVTCEFDPLRDEGLDYARRLGEAGVAVELHQFPGTFHGYDGLPAAVSERTYALELAALGRAVGSRSVGEDAR